MSDADDDSLMGDFEEDCSLGQDLSEGGEEEDAESRPSSAEGSQSSSPDVLTAAEVRCGTPPRLLDCGHSMGVISKFERVRILGVRAAQLSRLAPSALGEVADADPLSIAQAEFESRKLPLTVQRRHPSAGTEVWRSRDMLWGDAMVEAAFDPDEWAAADSLPAAPCAMDTS